MDNVTDSERKNGSYFGKDVQDEKEKKWIWYVLWLLIAAIGGGGTLFCWMPRTSAMFYGGCAILVLSVMAGILLVLLAKAISHKAALRP